MRAMRGWWRRPSGNQRDWLWWARLSGRKPDESPWPADAWHTLVEGCAERRAAAEEERQLRRELAEKQSDLWPAEVDS